jgi:hypothetical protein
MDGFVDFSATAGPDWDCPSTDTLFAPSGPPDSRAATMGIHNRKLATARIDVSSRAGRTLLVKLDSFSLAFMA